MASEGTYLEVVKGLFGGMGIIKYAENGGAASAHKHHFGIESFEHKLPQSRCLLICLERIFFHVVDEDLSGGVLVGIADLIKGFVSSFC